MHYKEIKKELPKHPYTSLSFAAHVCGLITPFLISIAIRLKIRPNTITLFMIITGVIAGVVLFLPFWWCKIIAGFLYYFWYALDETDGNVARITQTFSKGGKYLDWCAHLLTHPLFAVAMWFSFVNMYDFYIITIVSFVLIVFELLGRNWISMATLYGDVKNTPYQELKPLGVIRYIFGSFFYMPNDIIFFPFVVGINILFDWTWFYWFYICWALYYSAESFRVFIMFIWKMYKSA